MQGRHVGLLAVALIACVTEVFAGTIYRCRSYGGAYFWSSGTCSQHKATIDRIASVPDGMPFEQQVAIAEAELGAVRASVQAERSSVARQNRCSALLSERNAIWRRSGSGTGNVPIEQLGADRTRWRQINDELASAGCGNQ